jgi:hypothetical protein
MLSYLKVALLHPMYGCVQIHCDLAPLVENDSLPLFIRRGYGYTVDSQYCYTHIGLQC